jgi:hypothetical protein
MISQRLVFSTDTVVQQSCESFPPPFETIDVINNTDEDILLRWNRMEFYYPYDGSYFLVIDPMQFIPNTYQGQVMLTARDTSEIIFHIFTDFMWPGDTAFIQINVYDESDSINTSRLLTAIKFCPLETSSVAPETDIQLSVFPNPIYHEATIYIPEPNQVSLIDLYSLTGKLVMQIPVTENEINFSTDGLPAGIYLLTAVKDGRTSWMTKVVVLE